MTFLFQIFATYRGKSDIFYNVMHFSLDHSTRWIFKFKILKSIQPGVISKINNQTKWSSIKKVIANFSNTENQKICYFIKNCKSFQTCHFKTFLGHQIYRSNIVFELLGIKYQI